ncbi:MAG: O-antigen ligase family protein [Gammaproteobacteria bacterium]|nr:O-antigen ligase family protein [Gammaproteobacteria bacterium]
MALRTADRPGRLTARVRAALLPASVGTTGLYVFAASAWLSPAAARVALGLMLLAALGQARELARTLAHSPVAAATGVWVVAVLLSYAGAEPVAAAASHSEAATKLVWLSAFLLVAWWVRGDPRRVWTVLGLALAGFLLRRALYLPRIELGWLAAGMRTGLGLPEIATATYSLIGLAGLLLASPRFWLWTGTLARGAAAAALRALWVGAGLSLVLLVLVSQSRAVWVLAVAALPLLAGWLVLRTGSRQRAVAGLTLVLLAGLLLAYWDFIAARFDEDSGAFRAVVSGDWAAVPYTSGGLRVHLWRLGVEWWLQAPWLGHGPAALPALIGTAGVPDLLPLDDVHNVALDLLVRLGLTGLTAYLSMLVLVLQSWFRARRSGYVPQDLFLVVLAALALDALVGLTNCRTLSTDWKFFWLLFAGSAASFALRLPRPGTVAGTAPPTLPAAGPPPP